jgi:four helix bundle protein
MSPHQKLRVYQHALSFIAEAEVLIEHWPKKHAITDHLPQAAESVAVNLAESVRSDLPKSKETFSDYSLGSVFECAACLDIAVVKALLAAERARASKTRLARICGELVGLRKSWSTSKGVCEEGASYPIPPSAERPVFHHERLDVYQVALKALRCLDLEALREAPVKVFRKYDEPATSMLLNIAEGNGRYAQLDHCRFLGIANRGSNRLAVLLDVGVCKGLWRADEILEAKALLERVANMTRAMMGGCGEKDR